MTTEAPEDTTGRRKARFPSPRLRAIWCGRGRPWFRPRALLAMAFFGVLGYLSYQAALWTALWGGVIGWAGLALLAGAGFLFWRAASHGWRFFAHLGLRGALIIVGLPTLLLFVLSIMTVGAGLGPRAWLMVGGIMVQQVSDVVRPIGLGLARIPDDIALSFTSRSFGDWFAPPAEPIQVSRAQEALPTAAPEETASVPLTAEVEAFQVGDVVRVVTSDGSGLRVRQEPGIDQPIITRLSAGATIAITGGPTTADGYQWWRVRGDWGEGWCAAEFLEPMASP